MMAVGVVRIAWWRVGVVLERVEHRIRPDACAAVARRHLVKAQLRLRLRARRSSQGKGKVRVGVGIRVRVRAKGR